MDQRGLLDRFLARGQRYPGAGRRFAGIGVRYDFGDGHVAWAGDDQQDLLNHLPTWFGAAASRM
jgi:hypothetical protein